MLAVSPTYGVPKSGSLDLQPLLFPAQWSFGHTHGVSALRLVNVGTDLTTLDNICDNLHMGVLPILPQLLAPQALPLSSAAPVFRISDHRALGLADEFCRRHR